MYMHPPFVVAVFISLASWGTGNPTLVLTHHASSYVDSPPPHSKQAFMMRQHGSSGELDVFGATSYFAGGGSGGLVADFPGEPAADRLIKESKVRMMEDQQQLGLHGDEHHGQLGGVGKQSGKSKLAALLSFVVSPSPRASFRKESPPSPPATTKKLLVFANKASSSPSSSSPSRESSVQLLKGCGGVQLLQGCGGVHGDELDLGVATGDRRLQGIRVVRGRSGGEERWVVRCAAWEEHHDQKMLDGAESASDPKDGLDDEGHEHGGNNTGGWESDSSSDLFDLDLEFIC